MQEIETIALDDLSAMASHSYGGRLVKAVVDVRLRRVVVDADMHADEEAYLLDTGSAQADVWSINLYPGNFGQNDFIEFDSVVNIRPSQNNLSRGVDDEAIRREIAEIVNAVVLR